MWYIKWNECISSNWEVTSSTKQQQKVNSDDDVSHLNTNEWLNKVKHSSDFNDKIPGKNKVNEQTVDCYQNNTVAKTGWINWRKTNADDFSDLKSKSANQFFHKGHPFTNW